MKNLIKLKKAKMEKKIKTLEVIKNVLSRKNYFVLFIIVSLILFIVFYFLTLATVTNQSLKIFIMMNGGLYALLTFLLLALIALLFGVYVCLIVFVIKFAGKGFVSGLFGGSGLIAGLFGAGCPMCGAFLFGLLGFPLVLFFMPFKGLELRLFSLILILVSIYFVARSLDKCKLK